MESAADGDGAGDRGTIRSGHGKRDPVAGSLQVARTGASATTLIDGRVLIAGGNDGTQDLASAEIYDRFDPAGFSPVDTQLQVARSGHTALLLPHNNGVLIAGGTANGAAVAADGSVLPAEFPDPYSWGTGALRSDGRHDGCTQRRLRRPRG